MARHCLFIGSVEESLKRGCIMKQIEEWIASKELAEIVKAFGGEIPKYSSLKEQVAWLLKFCDRWDYRSIQRITNGRSDEKARWQISKQELSDRQKSVVKNGIYALGLIGIDTPQKKDFDYVIALGGARYSCLYRPKYIRVLLQDNMIQTKKVILLSAMRPVLDSEREATNIYAPDALTEYDLINKGVEQVFSLKPEYYEERYHNENTHLNWAVRKYIHNGVSIQSFSGPSSEPNQRRANSADTYKFFIEKENVVKGSRLLLVTSQIYVPYQQMEAIRVLGEPYDLHIETVGFPPEWSGKLQGMMEPENYLQEIRSVIQSIGRYLKKYI